MLAVVAALLLGGCARLERLEEDLTETTDVELLAAVSLTEQDAAEGAVFLPYDGGDQVFGQTSLDLCYGEFPSEELRSGRNQVGIGDQGGEVWVSSEAILYPNPADAEQAMDELEQAREECSTGVVDPSDPEREPLTWDFAADPDADWPEEPGVDRQAYEFESTDPAGKSWTSTATYLQRGRMVLALYASPPESPATALRNSPGPARFVEVMSNRLAGLPEDALQHGDPLEDPNTITV